MTDQLSRNAQVLKFFAKRCRDAGQETGVVRLLKLAYLADLEARELLGRPVSEFDYIWYDHGPFDPQFYEAVSELKSKGHVRERKREFFGRTARLIKDTGEPAAYAFSDAEIRVMEFVADTFMTKKFDRLLADIVYQTPPMKEAQKNNARNQRLQMEMVDNRQKRKIGFDLEEVLKAEREIAEGHVVPGDQFLSMAKARLSAVTV